MIPLRKFLAMWDKIFSTENLDTPFLISIHFFSTGNFLEHSTEGFPYEVFRYCEKNQLRRKIVIPTPLSYPLHFSIPEINETLKETPTKMFGIMRQKILTENRDTPLLGIKFFDTRNCLKHRRLLLQNCSALWEKIFDRKFWYSPRLIHKFFRYPKFSETQKDSSTKFFVTVRQKNFGRKILILPPRLIH